MPFEDDDIHMTNGAFSGLGIVLHTVIDPGDEVILLDPYYPQHVGKVELAGGQVVTVPLDAANGFRIRADWIEAAVTPPDQDDRPGQSVQSDGPGLWPGRA